MSMCLVTLQASIHILASLPLVASPSSSPAALEMDIRVEVSGACMDVLFLTCLSQQSYRSRAGHETGTLRSMHSREIAQVIRLHDPTL